MTTPAQTSLENALTIGHSSFADIIDNKLLYVDKTDLVAAIARYCRCYFFSRPPRFGKTLLISTLHELFANGTEKFKGLKLERENLWNDHTYQVVRLEFSKISALDKTEDFNQKFAEHLTYAFAAAGITLDHTKKWDWALDDVLESLKYDALVLLIDDFDAPMIHALDDYEEFDRRSSIIEHFCIYLKNHFSKFRLIFMTGGTRFNKLDIFSGFNIVDNLSFDYEYGTLCGITQDELETCFGDYIDNAALVLKQKEPDKNWTRQKVLDELKYHYDGYCFDDHVTTKVYNPWTVMNFFGDPSLGFKHYWRQIEPYPAILISYLKHLEEQEDMFSELAYILEPDHGLPSSEGDFAPSIKHLTDENFPYFAILYNAGYLTVKKAYRGGYPTVCVGVPNTEFKEAFALNISTLLTKTANYDTYTNTYAEPLDTALCNKDFPALKEILNNIINEFSCKSNLPLNAENFCALLAIGVNILDRDGIVGERFTRVSSDMYIRTKDCLYIIEIYVAPDHSMADEAFEAAKTRLINSKYTLSAVPKQVVTAVMVIVNEKQDSAYLREIVRFEEISVPESLVTVKEAKQNDPL